MRSSRARVAVVAGLAGLVVAGLATVVGALATAGSAGAQPLYLEAAREVGDAPFVSAALKLPVSPQAHGAAAASGCDAATLAAALQADPRLAGAWTAALNSDPTLHWSRGETLHPSQVSSYIRELTPQLLTADLRVTNFRYVRGAAEPVQSVLQAGTAVLVDATGVARVRCRCGNPLTPMHPLTAKPTYRGTPWQGFVDIEIVAQARCSGSGQLDDATCPVERCPDGTAHDGQGGCPPEPCAAAGTCPAEPCAAAGTCPARPVDGPAGTAGPGIAAAGTTSAEPVPIDGPTIPTTSRATNGLGTASADPAATSGGARSRGDASSSPSATGAAADRTSSTRPAPSNTTTPTTTASTARRSAAGSAARAPEPGDEPSVRGIEPYQG